MERLINDNEKIRKAEEIYFRRNRINKVDMGMEKNINIKDKLFFHMLLIINIVVIVACMQNKEFIFTEDFLDSLNNYNVDIKSKIIYLVGNIVNKKEMTEDTIVKNNEDDYSSEVDKIEENLIKTRDETSSINEMDMDIANLKTSYSFIRPVDGGLISSRFGIRKSDNIKVNGYHTGIDIAAAKGTPIKASMGGIVTLVSKVGNYGNHVKIRCNNVTTLYAHCSKIFVNEGQIVAQGQVLGEVGSTGNSTGPHLHFEIRIDDMRFVDPGEIIL